MCRCCPKSPAQIGLIVCLSFVGVILGVLLYAHTLSVISQVEVCELADPDVSGRDVAKRIRPWIDPSNEESVYRTVTDGWNTDCTEAGIDRDKYEGIYGKVIADASGFKTNPWKPYEYMTYSIKSWGPVEGEPYIDDAIRFGRLASIVQINLFLTPTWIVEQTGFLNRRNNMTQLLCGYIDFNGGPNKRILAAMASGNVVSQEFAKDISATSFSYDIVAKVYGRARLVAEKLSYYRCPVWSTMEQASIRVPTVMWLLGFAFLAMAVGLGVLCLRDRRNSWGHRDLLSASESE